MKNTNHIANNHGQAMIETIIAFSLVIFIIMVFSLHMGFMQITKLRLAMANRFMAYTAAHAVRPDAGRPLRNKTKLMLMNGPPVISNNEKYFKNLQLILKERSIKIGKIKLPGGLKKIESEISIDYALNSRIMQKITRRKYVRLSSGKMVMFKESLYKKSLSLKSIKKFLKFKK